MEKKQLPEKEILSNVAAVTIDEPLKLEVDVNPQSRLHAFLQRKGWAAKKKRFDLTGVKLGTLTKISRLLLSIDIAFFDSGKILRSNYEAMDKYVETLAECVALCIHNKKGPVPKSLIAFVMQNFTTSELDRVLGIVIQQMDVGSFMTTIVSISGMNILAKKPASVENAD